MCVEKMVDVSSFMVFVKLSAIQVTNIEEILLSFCSQCNDIIVLN